MCPQIDLQVHKSRSLTPAFRSRFPNVVSGIGERDLVSVVIPVYNRGNLLWRALTSVANQSWQAIEAIVVDDGSTEDIASIVAEFPGLARLVRQANAGVTAARNRALAEARGEFIAFLDSDDIWDDIKIEAQVAVLRARPDAIMVGTDMRAIDDRGHALSPRYLRTFYGSSYARLDIDRDMPVIGNIGAIATSCPESVRDAEVRLGDLFGNMLHGNLIHTSTVLLRRTRLEAGGGFDPAFARTGEDYEFHWRSCYFGLVALLDLPLVSYRIGAGDQLTSAKWAYERALNALITVRYWLDSAGAELNCQPREVWQRMAELEQWCGERRVLLGEEGGMPHLLASLRYSPLNVRTWMLFLVAICPRTVRSGLLQSWRSRPSWLRRRPSIAQK